MAKVTLSLYIGRGFFRRPPMVFRFLKTQSRHPFALSCRLCELALSGIVGTSGSSAKGGHSHNQ